MLHNVVTFLELAFLEWWRLPSAECVQMPAALPWLPARVSLLLPMMHRPALGDGYDHWANHGCAVHQITQNFRFIFPCQFCKAFQALILLACDPKLNNRRFMFHNPPEKMNKKKERTQISTYIVGDNLRRAPLGSLTSGMRPCNIKSLPVYHTCTIMSSIS